MNSKQQIIIRAPAMSNRSGKISIAFGNDTHVFKLGYGQLKELQDAVDAGPFVIFDSLLKNTWKIEYIRETIRCGLVGGGMPAHEAIHMVKTYVEDVENYPLQANVLIAAAILNAALMGAPEEDVGKKNEKTGAKTSRRSKTGKSASRNFTGPEP